MTLSIENNQIFPEDESQEDNPNSELMQEVREIIDKEGVVIAEETKHELGLQAVMTTFGEVSSSQLQHPDNPSIILGDQ